MDAPPVQYVRTVDGYDIAYTVVGQGRPLVCVPFAFSHVELSWTVPGDASSLLECLAKHFRLIYYDSRGQGLSTRGLAADVSMDWFVSDLEAVTDKLHLDRFVLLGFGNAVGHTAIHFAAKHPHRVEALVLLTSALKADAWPVAIFEVLASQNWDSFLWTMAPKGGSLQDVERSVRRLQQSTTQDDWLATFRAFLNSEVDGLMEHLTMPTLVLHPRDFRTLRAEESTKLAARIPNARLVLLDGATRMGDARQCVKKIEEFLAGQPRVWRSLDRQPDALVAATPPDGLSRREVEVLCMIAEGKTNREIAGELVLSVRTVERHIANLYAKAGLRTKAQAASYAHQKNLLI